MLGAATAAVRAGSVDTLLLSTNYALLGDTGRSNGAIVAAKAAQFVL